MKRERLQSQPAVLMAAGRGSKKGVPVPGHLALVEKQVRNGGGAKPPFSDVLSAKDIDAVAHYVVEQIAPKA